MSPFADPHFIPRRQALNVRREDVLRRYGDAHPKNCLCKKRIGARRPCAVDVGKPYDKVVDPCIRGRPVGGFQIILSVHIVRRQFKIGREADLFIIEFYLECDPLPLHPYFTLSAFVTLYQNFCMSHAAVGQRSAQRPQWRQTSSSLTMMRAVWASVSET